MADTPSVFGPTLMWELQQAEILDRGRAVSQVAAENRKLRARIAELEAQLAEVSHG